APSQSVQIRTPNLWRPQSSMPWPCTATRIHPNCASRSEAPSKTERRRSKPPATRHKRDSGAPLGQAAGAASELTVLAVGRQRRRVVSTEELPLIKLAVGALPSSRPPAG